MPTFDFKRYHLRSIHASDAEERATINQELKDLYMSVLTNGFLSKKGGAGLGFLTMRIKSENGLKYSIENLDNDKSLFTVEILLNRQ